MELFREVIKQLKSESHLSFQDGTGLCQYSTRRKRFTTLDLLSKLPETNQSSGQQIGKGLQLDKRP